MTGRNIVAVLAALLLAAVASGQTGDLPTIAGIVAASGDGFDDDNSDFDILLAAVVVAELVEVLKSFVNQLRDLFPVLACLFDQ